MDEVKPIESERVETSLLACSVRGCGRPLHADARTWRCANGHTFDTARSGYVNLLQPQDRRSSTAGDPKAAVDARVRLAAAGVGRALINAVLDISRRATRSSPRAAIELGAGCGDALATITRTLGCAAAGLDLSPAAADQAARRYPDITWVVANADRRLPLRDGCADLMISLHARRNPSECARVLFPSGHLLVATPAPEDLIELRTAVQGEGVTRSRVDTLVTEHAAHFTVVSRAEVRERQRLSADLLRDLLLTTYRGGRRNVAARAEALPGLDVTQASDLVLFARR